MRCIIRARLLHDFLAGDELIDLQHERLLDFDLRHGSSTVGRKSATGCTERLDVHLPISERFSFAGFLMYRMIKDAKDTNNNRTLNLSFVR
jgi:hypothetical protein